MSFLESRVSYSSCQIVNFIIRFIVNGVNHVNFRILLGQSTFWILISLINLFIVSVNFQYQWIYSISIFNFTWIQSFLLRRYQEPMIHGYFIVTYLSSVERHRQVLYIIYFSTQALDVCLFASGLEARGCVCILRGSCNLWGL